MVPRTSLVQSQYLPRRVVEFVMVDLDVGKRRVELHIDVALPGRKLERRHGGGGGAGGVLVEEDEVAICYRMQCRAVQSGICLCMNRRQIWESQVWRRVTKQRTWTLSGTVGCWPGGERLVSWSLREAAELTSPTLRLRCTWASEWGSGRLLDASLHAR